MEKFLAYIRCIALGNRVIPFTMQCLCLPDAGSAWIRCCLHQRSEFCVSEPEDGLQGTFAEDGTNDIFSATVAAVVGATRKATRASRTTLL